MKAKNVGNRSPAKKNQNNQLKALNKLITPQKSKPTGTVHEAKALFNLPDMVKLDPSQQFWKEMNGDSPELAWEHLFGTVEDTIQDQAAKDLFLQLYNPPS